MSTKTRGWRGDSETHAATGRLGGLKTARKMGVEFYRAIGKKGAEARYGRKIDQ